MELVLDLDEVGLVAHHNVDRLVRRGMLVEEFLRAGVLPRRDAHRFVEALERELLPRLPPRHPASGAVRARLIRRLVPETPDHVRALAHRAGDQPAVADARADRALPRHPDLAVAVSLALGEVVVAVDLVGRGDLASQDGLERTMRRGEEQPAVLTRERLRPAEVAKVGVELRR